MGQDRLSPNCFRLDLVRTHFIQQFRYLVLFFFFCLHCVCDSLDSTHFVTYRNSVKYCNGRKLECYFIYFVYTGVWNSKCYKHFQYWVMCTFSSLYRNCQGTVSMYESWYTLQPNRVECTGHVLNSLGSKHTQLQQVPKGKLDSVGHHLSCLQLNFHDFFMKV